MIIIIVSMFIVALVQSRPRFPSDLEDIQCRFVYADQLATARSTDRRARIEAYRNSSNTSPCITTCRIDVRDIGRRRDIYLPPITSPDYVQCGRDLDTRLYCSSGACVPPPAGIILNTTVLN